MLRRRCHKRCGVVSSFGSIRANSLWFGIAYLSRRCTAVFGADPLSRECHPANLPDGDPSKKTAITPRLAAPPSLWREPAWREFP